ncbi:hypothetical protein HII12_003977 [Brettanomyces bruxellensis]|uniref:pH-response regulator protein palH/RIM21 n=1 Tax=Dekkera bruxellensis TaxID=5007 RepID=A0A8H6BCF9_DEKBR|nr:hypothetical protein HII12_003977 [Brettanomyces bruxellensis]
MKSQFKNIDWRIPEQVTESYPSCKDFALDEGVLVTDKGVFRLKDRAQYAFKAICENGQPVLSSMNTVFSRLGLAVTPIEKLSWHKYISHSTDSTMLPRFRYSIYPLVYSLCTGMVIILYCTSLLFTKHYITAFRPGFLMKSSCLVACAQVVAINVYSMVNIFHQGLDGKCSSTELLNKLTFSTGFNVVYLIVFLLLLLSQVNIVKRLYPRRNESKFILIIGTTLVIITEALWATANFLSQSRGFAYSSVAITSSDSTDSESSDENDENVIVLILPVFVYLLEISLSVLYTCLIYLYCLSKKRYAFKSSMIITTLLTIVAINSPIAFFLADISNVWVNKFSSFFSMASYVITNVATWEWLNQLEQVEKDDQQKNLLGRRFFLDDYIEEEYDDAGPEYGSKAGLSDAETGTRVLNAPTDTGNSLAVSSSGQTYNLKDLHGSKFKEQLSRYRDKIEKTFIESIRGIDLKQPVFLKKLRQGLPEKVDDGEESGIDLSTRSPDRDVYIYRKKEVVFPESAMESAFSNSNNRMEEPRAEEPEISRIKAVSGIIPALGVGLKRRFWGKDKNVINHRMKTLSGVDNAKDKGIDKGIDNVKDTPRLKILGLNDSFRVDELQPDSRNEENSSSTEESSSMYTGTDVYSGASLPSVFRSLSFDPSVHFEFGSDSETGAE